MKKLISVTIVHSPTLFFVSVSSVLDHIVNLVKLNEIMTESNYFTTLFMIILD